MIIAIIRQLMCLLLHKLHFLYHIEWRIQNEVAQGTECWEEYCVPKGKK